MVNLSLLSCPKILILHSGGIGDLLLALPALRLIRHTFPESPLELMGYPERLSLIAFDLQVRSIHFIDQAGMSFFYAHSAPLPEKLSRFLASFDIVFAFGQSNHPLIENLKKAGVKIVISVPSFPSEQRKIHVSDYLVEFLNSAGLKGKDPFIPLKLPEEDLNFARNFLRDYGEGKAKLLIIHPGSGSLAKNWAPENFAEVADRFGERAQILLISGPAPDGMEEIKKSLKKAIPFIAMNLPLRHLAAVIKSGTAYLGNDSGITHLAALLGLPTVAIFGPTDPAVWGPRGSNVNILYNRDSCSPCSSSRRRVCPRPCLAGIQSDRVINILSPFFE